MMVTADFKTSAQALFCDGVVGMARAGEVDSANSQFFIMTGRRPELDGKYTPFGRVLAGLDVARALKLGEGANGAVVDPDVMTRVRTAAAMPADDRPSARVMSAGGGAFTAFVAEARARRGGGFTVCDAQPPAEVSGADALQ
jgi:peptidylprolyl isomerase